MRNASKTIACCSLAVLIALYVVGAVSHGSLRHEVQTLPLWFPIVLGFRQRELAKWSALPSFIFWLVIMVFIWLFLLGWVRILTGHYSPVEVAMTIVVGVACVCGIAVSLRWRTAVRPFAAMGVAALFVALQIAGAPIEPDSIHRDSVVASTRLDFQGLFEPLPSNPHPQSERQRRIAG